MAACVFGPRPKVSVNHPLWTGRRVGLSINSLCAYSEISPVRFTQRGGVWGSPTGPSYTLPSLTPSLCLFHSHSSSSCLACSHTHFYLLLSLLFSLSAPLFFSPSPSSLHLSSASPSLPLPVPIPPSPLLLSLSLLSFFSLSPTSHLPLPSPSGEPCRANVTRPPPSHPQF